MRKIAEACHTVLRGVFFAGFTIRIPFGILWMAENLGSVPALAKENGMLYELFLRCMEPVGSFLHIPYCSIVYVLQTAALGAAVWICMGAFHVFEEKKGLKIWGLLAVMTNAITVQCMFALLPNAFLAALLLLFVSVAVKRLESGERRGKSVLILLFLWIAAGFLSREYWVLGGVFFLAVFLIWGKKKLPVVAVGGAVLLLMGAFWSFSGNIWRTAFSRVAFDTILKRTEDIPDFVHEVLTDGEILSSQLYADVLKTETMPLLEERLGKEEAYSFYRRAVTEAWSTEKRTILHALAWDFAGYLVPGPIVSLQMDGKGFQNCSLHNYRIMGDRTPVLARYYFLLELALFDAFLLTTFLCAIFGFPAEPKRIFGGAPKGWFLAAVMGLTQCAWYTFFGGAGCMDYKKSIVLVIFWEFCFLSAAGKTAET